MNPINTFRSICLDSDKENIHPDPIEARTTAAAVRIVWSQEPDSVMFIEKKEDLPSEDLWHDLRILGLEALIDRGDLDELREYADSYRMLQDPSEDGIVCPLENPGKYEFTWLKSVSDRRKRDLQAQRIIESFEDLTEQQLGFVLAKVHEIINSRSSDSVLNHP